MSSLPQDTQIRRQYVISYEKEGWKYEPSGPDSGIKITQINASVSAFKDNGFGIITAKALTV